MLAKGEQSLFLIRYMPCYSYTQSSPVKVLAVIEDRHIHIQKGEDPLSLEIWIFRSGQSDCDDDRRMFVAMTST